MKFNFLGDITMKTSLLTLAFAFMAFIPTVFAMDGAMHKDKAMAKNTVVTAVAFHSDNCGSCKILGPRMKEAMQVINTDKVDVVKFDFTNKNTIAAAKALAKEKGINTVLQKYGAKTGFVVLLNAKGEEVAKLKVDDNTADIAAKLAKAIVEAS
jgi:thiol-disulfide isomerase/thioredoxin